MGPQGAGPARVRGQAGFRASTSSLSSTQQILFQRPPDFSARQATGSPQALDLVMGQGL